ncbi:hypothetical protein GEMRC1_004478 [Eukaryota sp. GEM-RC1]
MTKKKSKQKLPEKPPTPSHTEQDSSSHGCCTLAHDLFNHLPQYSNISSYSLSQDFDLNKVHPSIIAVGLKSAQHVLRRGRERSVAMLDALRDLVTDLECSPKEPFLSTLLQALELSERFLSACRPLAPAQLSIIQYIKLFMSNLRQNDDKARGSLARYIEEFKELRVYSAASVISQGLKEKVRSNDVILTYGASTTVIESLINIAQSIPIKVIITDSRSNGDGFNAVTSLSAADVPVTFCLLSGLHYVLSDVTKVVLGVSALLYNGAAIGMCGTASVATLSHSLNLPVIVLCESYRFMDWSQLDSITWNEIGDPRSLVIEDVPASASSSRPTANSERSLKGWEVKKNLELLNLVYDVTPTEFIDMIVSEMGPTGPSSVPTIIREFKDALVKKETS